MKRTSLKALACTLCAALALVGGLALAGCSATPDPEEAIKADLTSNFDALKNLDEDAVEEMVEAMDSVGLDAYGIDSKELLASMLDGFDYSIDSIAVEDDTATATVTVTSKSMSELTNMDSDAMYDAIMEALTSGELDPNDDEAVNAWAGEYVMGILDTIEPSEKTVEIDYINGDDGWEMDESSSSEVERIFV